MEQDFFHLEVNNGKVVNRSKDKHPQNYFWPYEDSISLCGWKASLDNICLRNGPYLYKKPQLVNMKKTTNHRIPSPKECIYNRRHGRHR